MMRPSERWAQQWEGKYDLGGDVSVRKTTPQWDRVFAAGSVNRL